MSCCDRWAEYTGQIHSLSPMAGAYPPEVMPSAQIERGRDGWHINGCCGGGCYVVTDLKFCPFCGESLAP